MKPKTKMKLVLGRSVACGALRRSARELTLLLCLFALGSVYLSYQLGSLLSGFGGGWLSDGHGATNGVKGSCGFAGLLSVTSVDVTPKHDYLRTSDVLLQALKAVEEEDLLASNSGKVILVGDSSDQTLRYRKAFEKHGFQTQVFTSTSSPGRDDCAIEGLWICLGTCGRPGRKCHAERRTKVNRFGQLSEQLGERDALCNALNTLRKHGDGTSRWSALPLCFVLPEQAQQLTDVAGALPDADQSTWLLRPVGSRDGRTPKARHVATTTLADSGLLQKTLSPLLERGRVVAEQMLDRPLLTSHGRPVLVRVFVLVTSLVPLRAYMHQAGNAFFQGAAVQGAKLGESVVRMDGKSVPLKQFWQQLEHIHGALSADQVWSHIKNQAAALLLAAEYEILSKSMPLGTSDSLTTAKGSASFQLLSLEFALNATLQPSLRNVNVKPHLLASRSLAMDAVKSEVLADVARILTADHLVALQVAQALRASAVNVGLMCLSCRISHDICLTERDLSYLLTTRRELLAKGMFEQIYPSVAGAEVSELLSSLDQKMQKEVFSSAAARHSSVFDVSKQHQTAQLHKLLLDMEAFYAELERGGHSNRSGVRTGENKKREQQLRKALSRNFVYEEEEIDCSQDPATLPYLRILRINPERKLSPSFQPNKTEYHLDVPYEQTSVEVRARALYCHAEARLDDRLGPARPVNYTLGLGYTRISVVVVDIRHVEARVANAYVLSVFRRERVSRSDDVFQAHVSDDYVVCSLKQSCELMIYPKERCGLQQEGRQESWSSLNLKQEYLNICRSGYEDGRWLLPCVDCRDSGSCLWSTARWTPFRCRYPSVSNASLQTCLDGKKLLFLGDSTNRGIMYYVLMRLNGTLGEWHKSHGIALHAQSLNGGRTAAGFAYYPHFWLPTNRRPTLARTLGQLVDSMPSLENSPRTVLVVGGVQWLNAKQLSSLASALRGLRLDNARIIVKTFGSGFHQKTDGLHPSNLRSQQALGRTNRDLIRRAIELNMEVIDTFNLTSARFKDFMQGDCACHFHKVVSDSLTTYRVEGPVNQAYSDILLSRLCKPQRK
ncbi:cadherin-like and PC-esterase domain-containing protein 1 [Haemaphysalis longicornis]